MMRISSTRLDNSLVKIIKEYNMDGKNNVWGTDKNNPHTYCDFYEELFQKYQDKEINILEIGSEFGCSALLFNKFLPKATIVSVDVNPNIVNLKVKELVNSNVSFHILDAYTDDAVLYCKNLHPEGYDVIIDDGPHSLESQIISIQKYLSQLKRNGSFVIEDISMEFNARVLQSNVPSEYNSQTINLKSLKYNVYDDILLHIKYD